MIEKDDGVRGLVVRTLAARFGQVQEARSLLAAALDHQSRTFDLVIMNGGNGGYDDQLQLEREARALWASHVMLMSGAVVVPRPFIEYDSFVLLAKPFLTKDLLAAVEVALTR